MTLILTPGTDGLIALNVVRQLVAPTPETVCADAGDDSATSQMRAVTTVMAVRRIVGILAPLIVVLATAAPAWAHPGIDNPYVPIGQPANVVFDVPAEEPSPMVGVDLVLPPDVTLTRLDQTPGWKSTSSRGALHFDGGPAAQGTFVQFTFAGLFAKKAVLLVPCTIRGQDGSVRHWNGKLSDPFPAVPIFPGYPVGQAPIPGLPASSSARSVLSDPKVWGGSALFIGGALLMVRLAVVSRRSRKPSSPGPSKTVA
jgi:uncharacterized protein YcnI